MRQDLRLDIADLRHYSVIFLNSGFEIWEARCEGEGFLVQVLAMGNLKIISDLKRYVGWSNAIHNWGLGQNAAAYKKDVLELLKRSAEQQSSKAHSLDTAPPREAIPAVSAPPQAPEEDATKAC
jgi:hypothetical protein